MDRIETLFEKWMALDEAAFAAIMQYDTGGRAEGMEQLRKIWDVFQQEFSKVEDRKAISGAYEETMSMVLNRMYLDMKEDGGQLLWKFCSRVCSLFEPDEIWMEDYVCCVAELLRAQKEYERSEAWLQEWQQREPDQPVYTAQLAMVLLEKGETEEAAEILDGVLRRNLECDFLTLSFFRMARRIYVRLGRMEQVEICRRKICELDADLLLEEE